MQNYGWDLSGPTQRKKSGWLFSKRGRAPAAHLTACSNEETTVPGHTHIKRRSSSPPCCQRELTVDWSCVPLSLSPMLHPRRDPFYYRRASHSPLTRRWIGVRCRVRARRSAIERQRECCFLPVCAETCSSGAQHRSRASCVSAHRLGGKGQSARLQAIRAPSAWLSLSSSLELQALHVWLHERAPASVFSSEYANIHTFQRSLISQAAFPLPTELLKT